MERHRCHVPVVDEGQSQRRLYRAHDLQFNDLSLKLHSSDFLHTKSTLVLKLEEQKRETINKKERTKSTPIVLM
jgi:hypothetical protein